MQLVILGGVDDGEQIAAIPTFIGSIRLSTAAAATAHPPHCRLCADLKTRSPPGLAGGDDAIAPITSERP